MMEGAAAMDQSSSSSSSSSSMMLDSNSTEPEPGAADIRKSKTPARPAAPVPVALRIIPGGTGGRGKAYPEDSIENRRHQLQAMYSRLAGPQGLALANFGEFIKQFCRLPSYFKIPLFKRIVSLYGAHAK